MAQYVSKMHPKPINLTDKDLNLLSVITNLGFVNRSQIDMLYSIVQHYPLQLPRTILSEWCSYAGLLNIRSKPTSKSNSAVSRVVYVPTNNCRSFLNSLGIPVDLANLVSVNSHNEQAIEAIVQSLYSVVFKNSLYSSTDTLLSPSSLWYLGQSESPIKLKMPEASINNQSEKANQVNRIIQSSSLLTQIDRPLKKSSRKAQVGRSIRNKGAAATTSATKNKDKKKQRQVLSNLIYTSTLQVRDSLIDGSLSLADYNNMLQSLDSKHISQSVTKTYSAYIGNAMDKNKESSYSVGSNTSSPTAGTRLNAPGARKIPVDAFPFGVFTGNASDSWLSDFRQSAGKLIKSSDLSKIFPGSGMQNISESRMVLNDLLFGDASRLVDPSGLANFSWKDSENNQIISSNKPNIVSIKPQKYSDKKPAPARDVQSDSEIAEKDGELNSSQAELDKLLGFSSENKADQKGNIGGLGDIGVLLGGEKHKNTTQSKESVKNELNADKTGISQDISKLNLEDLSINGVYLGSVKHQNTTLNSDKSKLANNTDTAGFDNDLDSPSHDLQTDIGVRLGCEKHKNYTFSERPAKTSSSIDITATNSKSANLNIENLSEIGVRLGGGKLPKVDSDIDYNFPTPANQIQSDGQNILNLANLNLQLDFLNQKHQAEKALSSRGITQSDFRYPPLQSNNLLRNINLISKPGFSTRAFDLSSFKNQYKYQQYTFVADEVISFYRNRRRQEVFIELDNRTEANNTQIQKILNYISYALDHPNRDILMVVSITDGSLSSNRVPRYTNLGRKLGILAEKFLKTYLPDKQGNRVYLSELYQQATNLEIDIAGVSETQIDIAQFIQGSNFILNYYENIQNYIKLISKTSDWNVTFSPSSELKQLLHDPELLASSINDFDRKIVSDSINIWRYIKSNSASPLLGKLHFSNKLNRTKLTQSVIAGREHSLDTIVQTYNEMYLAQAKDNKCPPLVVYPTRERPVTAVTLPMYKKIYNWTQGWTPSVPILLQPMFTVDNNVQLHKELRWLTIQYDTDVYNYFKIGAINKAQLKKHPDYGSEFINPLRWSLDMKPRSYNTLHQLALKLDKKSFVDQLKLNEIPLGIFHTVLKRWPTGIYSPTILQNVSYEKDMPTDYIYRPKAKFNIKDYVFLPNSTTPDARIKPIF